MVVYGGVCALMVLSGWFVRFHGAFVDFFGVFRVVYALSSCFHGPPRCLHAASMVFAWCLHSAFMNAYCASMMFSWSLHGASVVVFVNFLEPFMRTSRTPKVLLRCFHRLQ